MNVNLLFIKLQEVLYNIQTDDPKMCSVYAQLAEEYLEILYSKFEESEELRATTLGQLHAMTLGLNLMQIKD